MLLSTTLLLRALQHPQADSIQLDAFRNLVAWLEDRKIRHYKVEQRSGLAASESPQWLLTFEKYLEDLDCPVAYRHGTAETQLSWLLRLAVAREYEDKKDSYRPGLQGRQRQQKATAAPPPAATARLQQPSKQHLDLSSPETEARLSGLLDMMSRVVPEAHGSLTEALKEAHAALIHRILPAAIADEQGTDSVFAKFADFPLGFSTSDEKLDTAATLLRVLYVRELRKLQSAVDETIVSVSEFTADPVTDSSLGRVGR